MRKLLSGRRSQTGYWSIVERIGAARRSSLDLDAVLTATAAEIGRALAAPRTAIILLHENGLMTSTAYSEPGISPGAVERLAAADREIMSGVSSVKALTEIDDPARHPVLRSLLAPGSGSPGRTFSVKSIWVAPLALDSETYGAIIVYLDKKRRWGRQQKHFVQAAASNLSITIYHSRLREKARNAASREALTNKLLTAIRTAVGVEGVLKVAVDSLGHALGLTRAVIYMHSGANEEESRGKQAGAKPLARAEYRASVLVPSLLGSALDIEGSPLLGKLLGGEIIAIPDTGESHPVIRAIGVRLGVRALALAPISYNGRTVATLTLEQFDKPRVFSEEEVRLISLVTEQTAVALYQADLYREADEAARRDALISRITSEIHSSLDSETVLQAIVNELAAALSVCRCRLALLPNPLPEYIPVTHTYTAACCEGRQPAVTAIQIRDNPHIQAVLTSQGPIAIDDVAGDLLLAPFRERFQAAGVRSLLVTAIRLDGRPIGIFSLHHCERRHSWTQWEIDVVAAVGEQAAVAIRQAELYREARESATGAALVNQIVASIRRSLDLKETMQVAVDELGRALGANRTSFRKVIGHDVVVVAEHLSDPGLSVRHLIASTDSYIMKHVIETRRTLIIDDVAAFKSAHPGLAATVSVWRADPVNMSQIVCPIFISGQFWGALSISQTDQLRRWTASEIALVEVVTAQIEVAVSHSYLFEEAKRAAQLEGLISHIIHGINQSNRLDEILPIVASELGEHLGADSLLIAQLNDQTGLWTIECEYGGGEVSRPRRAYRAEDFEAFDVLMENGLLVCSDVEIDPSFAPFLEKYLRPAGTRAMLAVRVQYQGSPRLSIAAIMKSGPRGWGADEIEIMRAAANQVLIALERAELFEQISRGKYEWEATFDALNDGIYIFDEHGLLRRVNQAGAAFEGTQVRQLIGRRCCSLLQGIEGESCRVAKVIKTGRPVTFELVPERLSRPMLVTISPLTGDGGSSTRMAALGAVCIVRDLSELRAAEAVAREQRGFLVKLIEHANDAIFALSPEGMLIWFNEQLTNLSGQSRAELTGGDYRKVLPREGKSVAVERFGRALSGQAQTFELRWLKQQGETRLVLVTYTPIYDEDRVTSVLVIARDITEERLASERAAQADKLRALGQLASGVAHNFNNILAAIVGHAQLVKRECDQERILRRLDIIEHAALDGAQTVKRIQGFALQQEVSASETVDINQIVHDSTSLTRARWYDEAQARGLHFEVELGLQSAPPVRGSASELREVFVNIILNALDAMPQGGRLKITTEVKDSHVRTCFIDNGIGMSPEVRDRLFEPFFTTKGTSGMGLGLAVSYNTMERHGGRIEAQSNPGCGSTFVVTLPVARADRRKAPRDQARPVDAASILVIDDDERVREALVGLLKTAGHHTQHAESGRAGIEKMFGARFDLVITDLSMPEMDGWAVASEIKRLWPGVKIVLMTGHAVPDETMRSHRNLVNEVLLKPIRLDDISTTLSQVLP